MEVVIARLACVLLCVALGCGQAEEKSSARVTIIGIDGASPRLLGPWMKEGILPNLAKLAQQGAWGRLRSHKPTLSPRIWTSIATGKLPLVHKIGSWVHRDEQGKMRLFRSTDRRGAALWNIVSEAGMSVSVVNWLVTHPPEKVNGVVISDFAVPGQQAAQRGLGQMYVKAMGQGEDLVSGPDRKFSTAVYPAEWAERFASLVGQRPALMAGAEGDGLFVDPKTESVRRVLARAHQVDSLVAAAALEISRREDPDVMMILLTGIDRVSHFLWAGVEDPETLEPEQRLGDARREAFLAGMRAYHAYTDRLLGQILASRGEDGLVLVVSDHGFETVMKPAIATTGGHNSDAAVHGVAFARGRGFEPGTSLRGMSVNDVTPTVLAWLGLPLAHDMQGKPAAGITVSVPPILSYNRIAIERVEEVDDETEERIIEELRALGYLDPKPD